MVFAAAGRAWNVGELFTLTQVSLLHLDRAVRAFSGRAGFQNDGDNEITGIDAANGDPSPQSILGAQLSAPTTAAGCRGLPSTAFP
ncbi:hypothetical protein AB0L41_23710 [Amycolatopsis mediterranei]|uniref:hypothetical protein n=1 Tax=Amycolatopsis mediterranei TaxID=33910 RepID=UPI003443A529